MNDFLLDTCAVIWIGHGDPLREPGASEVKSAYERGARLLVSPITAWEIATLAAKSKITLTVDPGAWFERFCALPSVTRVPLPTSVLVASATLPGAPPDDPADRILIATARAYGCVLATRDAAILRYGAAGHARVVRC